MRTCSNGVSERAPMVAINVRIKTLSPKRGIHAHGTDLGITAEPDPLARYRGEPAFAAYADIAAEF
ncbi:hypothetical protein BCEP4_430017 [Burkholderia cepacia]|nr:hypothetical protein BCEP4_430017 [Burkholderia cepacia]